MVQVINNLFSTDKIEEMENTGETGATKKKEGYVHLHFQVFKGNNSKFANTQPLDYFTSNPDYLKEMKLNNGLQKTSVVYKKWINNNFVKNKQGKWVYNRKQI